MKLVIFWELLLAPFKAKIEEGKARKAKQKREQEEKQAIEKLKKDFEKQFKLKISTSIKAMGKANQTDPEHLKNAMIESRKYMIANGISPGGGQITDINAMNEHNEHGGYTNKSITEVKIQDRELARKAIEGKLDKELKQKAKFRWINRE